MFSSSFSSNTQTQLVENHHGIDLSTLSCHKLQTSPIYSKYSKDQLHYVIDAVQKGRNVPTKNGIKRLIKKNKARAAKNKLNRANSIPELNPKAPQEICMKVLRTEFRNEMEKNHMQEEALNKLNSASIIKRKQHQRARRNELIRLVKKYRVHLKPHFGTRLNGYGRCPYISRQQIKDYLKTLGIQAILDPVQPQERQARRVRGGKINRNQRMPRGRPMPINNFGQLPSLMGQMAQGFLPPFIGQMGGVPLMGGVPFGGVSSIMPPMIVMDQKAKLESTITRKDIFLKLEPNTVRRIILPSLKYAIKQAGIPQSAYDQWNKRNLIELNFTLSQQIIKQEIAQIFKYLQDPTEIKNRAVELTEPTPPVLKEQDFPTLL